MTVPSSIISIEVPLPTLNSSTEAFWPNRLGWEVSFFGLQSIPRHAQHALPSVICSEGFGTVAWFSQERPDSFQ